MKRRAVISGRAEYFKRGHKAGFYSKDSTGMGERHVPAYLVMDAFKAVYIRRTFFCCGYGIHRR